MLDVVIIGAGPAGTAAALTAVRAGMRVAIFDRAAFPRRRPGETLHPGMESLYKQLGVMNEIRAAGFLRHHGIWVEWDTPRMFQSYGEDSEGKWTGFQAERSVLDDILLKAAAMAGVETFLSEPAVDVILDNGRVVGIRTDSREIIARWVVDASGYHHWLARKLKLSIEVRGPSLFARFGWDDSLTESAQEPKLRATASGWHWHAPLASGRIAYCILEVGRQPPDHTVAFSFMQDVTWRSVTPCAGAGYFLLGDAAGVLDPLSSHGILRAVMCGMFVGHQFAAVQKSAIAENRAVEEYRKWHNTFFEQDIKKLRSLYLRHPHLSGLFH